MSVDDVARRFGSSRSALYRQFGSWSANDRVRLREMLEHLDSYVPRPRDDRATEFEAWWSALTDLLGSVKGVGFSPCVRSQNYVGSERLEEFEARQLVSLVQWCATSPAALRATWSLVRAASARKLSAQERLELREIVWLMVGGQLKAWCGRSHGGTERAPALSMQRARSPEKSTDLLLAQSPASHREGLPEPARARRAAPKPRHERCR
ncbi:MAG: hypothetical protein IPJ65_11240 [Archangiaceae bacterium]|nr:hypothetical protein [Archangiaceae bacterium]